MSSANREAPSKGPGFLLAREVAEMAPSGILATWPVASVQNELDGI